MVPLKIVRFLRHTGKNMGPHEWDYAYCQWESAVLHRGFYHRVEEMTDLGMLQSESPHRRHPMTRCRLPMSSVSEHGCLPLAPPKSDLGKVCTGG